MSRAVRMRGRGRGLGGAVLRVRLRERVSHQAFAGDCARTDRRADQECAASFIMLAHACFLPLRVIDLVQKHA